MILLYTHISLTNQGLYDIRFGEKNLPFVIKIWGNYFFLRNLVLRKLRFGGLSDMSEFTS